jgi:catechol 2,3-dioxygenase-like lactoylglutathione lyase family enzyme
MKRVESEACATETAIGASPVGFHVSLNVSDLARSVAFYRKVFGASPTKERADYAKFEAKNPPITLSLEPTGAVGSGGALNHIGFRLSSAEELVDLQRRLEMAGLRSQRENGVECCYSRQTKFWLHDPDQTLWEFYVLEDDVACCGSATEATAKTVLPTIQVPTAPPIATRPSSPIATDWEHRLDAPFPIPLPFDGGSLKEVRLRGTFNVPIDGTTREVMFAEILRVLSADGRVVLHQLTADRPLTEGFLSLPGPAAVVKEVPVDRDVLAWVENGGFEQIRLVKFSGSPTFEIDGVALRELIIEARKPAAEDREDEVTVVYKGPYRDLVDDAGRVFRRGERVAISAETWNAIRSGPLEESFVCLKDSPVVSRHGNT